MKMEKKKIRIGDLADHLGVERFVVRFWEKEFGIKAQRSDGGQRFYTERDLKKFETIKELLYDKKFTIAGAKNFMKGRPVAKEELMQESPKAEKIIASHVTCMEPEVAKVAESKEIAAESTLLSPDVTAQMLELQKKLLQLRELL